MRHSLLTLTLLSGLVGWASAKEFAVRSAKDIRAAMNAAQAGDTERERQALERLLERAPGRGDAVERLAELELLAGRTDRASKLRARKAELDRAKTHYEILVTKPSAEAVLFDAQAPASASPSAQCTATTASVLRMAMKSSTARSWRSMPWQEIDRSAKAPLL